VFACVFVWVYVFACVCLNRKKRKKKQSFVGNNIKVGNDLAA